MQPASPLRSPSCRPRARLRSCGCPPPPRLRLPMHLVFALSISGELQKIGALAGLAAIPALAVLALLYFAQAREVKRLREWAGRAPERAHELQERVAGQTGRTGTIPPQPA